MANATKKKYVKSPEAKKRAADKQREKRAQVKADKIAAIAAEAAAKVAAVAAPAKRVTKASHVIAAIAANATLAKEEMVLLVRKLNDDSDWGIPAANVRPYVLGNMKKAGLL